MSNTNRYYTIMLVPEKTSNVKKWIIPAWLFRGSALLLAFLVLLTFVMVVDYWYVMNQISENRTLKLENRKLRSQVQVFKTKMTTLETTLDRVKTFTTRLKVITNIEDRSALLQSLNSEALPDAATNVGTAMAAPLTQPPAMAAANPVAAQAPAQPSTFEEDEAVREELTGLDRRFSILNRDSLYLEQVLQDQYELLADQKAFLTALPVRKPTVGYFTSGFGVRKSPYGGRVKMHEGLDIANRPGTLIRAPADGVVMQAESRAGYGQTLILSHGYGIETWYAHTQKILVKKGSPVHRGDTIAQLGNTGRSTGPHLHYEVRVNGTPVDPLTYILEN